MANTEQAQISPAGHVCCSIIPPHLLRGIADSDAVDEHTRSHARATLDATYEMMAHRHMRARQRAQAMAQGIVPDHVLSGIAGSSQADDATRRSAAQTLQDSQQVRAKRDGITSDDGSTTTAEVDRAIYDMQHRQSQRLLPGQEVRAEGSSSTSSSDADVNACYDNFGYTWDFYYKILGRNSIDDRGLELIGSVHYATNFANAFWDGEQMVFGDGNTFLYHFCQCLDVIGHELTHGVTQYTAKLEYSNQSGALNESISDVFGSMIKQYQANETADAADWLIGEGCLFPGVKGVALRSMKAPGTAYNDPKLGKDPQGDSMSSYNNTTQDNGGVHINSGIPNRAFYLAAVGFGGYSWDKAGKVWYAAILSPDIRPDFNFKQFANLTISLAKQMFPDDGEAVLTKAWQTVEVI